MIFVQSTYRSAVKVVSTCPRVNNNNTGYVELVKKCANYFDRFVIEERGPGGLKGWTCTQQTSPLKGGRMRTYVCIVPLTMISSTTKRSLARHSLVYFH